MIRKQPLFSRPAQQAAPVPKRRSFLGRVWGGMGRALRKTCTVIGALILFSAFVNILVFSFAGEEKKITLPDQFILTLALDEGLHEDENKTGGLIPRSLLPEPMDIYAMIDTIERSANDKRVKALAVSIEGGGFPMTSVQELRGAITKFRASGRPTIVFSPSFADAASNFTAYYLASSFDEIWMQPVGMIFMTGIDTESPYIRSALEKIGVKGAYFQRKEYKNAFEGVTSDSMSEASAEMNASMLADIMDQLLDDVSADRKMARDDVMAAIDLGVLTDEESVARGFVDHLGFGDDAMKALRKKLGVNDEKSMPAIVLEDYRDARSHEYLQALMAKKPGEKDKKRQSVAVVNVSDMIMPGTGESGGMFSDKIAGAEDISAAIRKAAKDENIAAIVLRINSPGGSPSASETIRHATSYAREKGKPVIVSMGSVAGSGGYWIATDASHIFAMPTTMTGSIGVIAGKFDLSDLWTKLGVNWDGVSVGENADMWSFNKGFDESGTERMNAMTDRIYAVFIKRVAEGRNMTPEQVEEVARGRVWTGRQAHKIGLVDSLGGLNDALDYAAKDIGAGTRHDVRIVRLPEGSGPLYELMKELGIEVRMPNPINAMMQTWTDLTATSKMPGGVAVYDAGLNRWK